MKVVYTAPNYAHHYKYAEAMYRAKVLKSFISGFSRYSSKAKLAEIGNRLYRADIIQTLYVASLKAGVPTRTSAYLAYLSKIEQDNACKRFIGDSDIFLFYNGSGLNSCQYAKRRGTVCIVEAVNSHVLYQENILREEFDQLGLPWIPFHNLERDRRLKEYDLADYILLPSDFVKNSFLEFGFPESKLLKVPYGFSSFTSVDKHSLASQQDFVVLYVGAISVRKGVRYLIEAFKRLKHPRKKLILVGPMTEQTGLEHITISSDVIFTGVLKGQDLHAMYQQANVFCLPSIEEGLALVLGEALSFGLPIIATQNTGVSDIITDEKEGFITPIKDANAISDKLQLLADDTELYKLMQHSAKLKSQQLDGWNESGNLLVKSLYSIYNTNKNH